LFEQAAFTDNGLRVDAVVVFEQFVEDFFADGLPPAWVVIGFSCLKE
jgi:hypothetical protein